MPDNSPESKIERLCIEKGMKMTGQRRVIARVLSESGDHPDVEEVQRRSNNLDSRISIATVYRTVRLFEDANIINRHDFGDGRARYEEVSEEHHDHLIDIQSGKIVEFHGAHPIVQSLDNRLGYASDIDVIRVQTVTQFLQSTCDLVEFDRLLATVAFDDIHDTGVPLGRLRSLRRD